MPASSPTPRRRTITMLIALLVGAFFLSLAALLPWCLGARLVSRARKRHLLDCRKMPTLSKL